MNVELRMPTAVYQSMRDDLARPHPFAFERIGFLSTSHTHGAGQHSLILAMEYHSIPDEDYIRDEYCGARIGTRAIQTVLQRILDHKHGQMHVHLHGHAGLPRPSRTDASELPRLISSFQRLNPLLAHGWVIFSLDSALGDVWGPKQTKPNPILKISAVGFPFKLLQ